MARPNKGDSVQKAPEWQGAMYESSRALRMPDRGSCLILTLTAVYKSSSAREPALWLFQILIPNSYPALRHSPCRPRGVPAPCTVVRMAMSQLYTRMDLDSRYGERSMDAKIVVMGNTYVVSPKIYSACELLILISSQRCWQDQPVAALYAGQV